MAVVAINHPLVCQDLLPFHQISHTPALYAGGELGQQSHVEF